MFSYLIREIESYLKEWVKITKIQMVIDPLAIAFSSLCEALSGLKTRVDNLSKVNDSISEFNNSFGTFQKSIIMHASCLSYPEKEVRLQKRLSQDVENKLMSGIPAPQVSSNSLKSRSPEYSIAPQGRVKPTSVKKQKQSTQPEVIPWKWEKNMRSKIPRKYQSKEELKKLENVIMYLKNARCGITLADLVKHSGMPVIKCKEILQTLTKLEIILRKREKAGFAYMFKK